MDEPGIDIADTIILVVFSRRKRFFEVEPLAYNSQTEALGPIHVKEGVRHGSNEYKRNVRMQSCLFYTNAMETFSRMI